MTTAATTTTTPKRTPTIVVIGNPNTGKTTLFNALSGYRQRVGNYPGVTVDRKTAMVDAGDGVERWELADLPGTYNLSATSADEAVVLEVLLGRMPNVDRPDLIVNVVDATDLRHNLFLTSQLLELGIPMVVALNMTDLAESAGIHIDANALAKKLGVPVVPVVARSKQGIDALKRAVSKTLATPVVGHCPAFPACVCAELDMLGKSVETVEKPNGSTSRAELLQSLLEPNGYHEQALLRRCGLGLADELHRCRDRIAAAGESLPELEARVRYAWIERVIEHVRTEEKPNRGSRTDRVDRVLTHPILGLVVLLAIMTLAFQAIYTWAGPLMDAIDGFFAMLGGAAGSLLPEGPLRSLVSNGIIAGVGAVLIFLPQIMILFLFIAILEDCGYMARAAFVLDRWMSKLGLNGKSFIPLVSSFACAIPGIMATRTIEDRRSRFVTITIAPLMSCSARLPVYTLLIAAFIPATPLLGGFVGLQAVTMVAMYSIGVIVAVAVAFVLQRTMLKGKSQPFLMELPSYKWPAAGTVLYRVWEQGREFCITAGTFIFAVAIVIWALAYYPHPAAIANQHDAMRTQAQETIADSEALEARLDEIDRSEAGTYIEQSVLGRAGQWIEPVVKPLGWDWRIGTAAIASFPAREVVIATLGTIYHLGDDQDETSVNLREKLKASTWPGGEKVFTIPVALSIMVFFALCCQCGATLATIRRETKSWRWPIFTFAYMTGLAYVAALVTYQVGSRLFS